MNAISNLNPRVGTAIPGGALQPPSELESGGSVEDLINSINLSGGSDDGEIARSAPSLPTPPRIPASIASQATPAAAAPTADAAQSTTVAGDQMPLGPNGKPGLSSSQANIVSVLARHQDALSKKGMTGDDYAKMANDPKTPPDLRDAIQQMMQDPRLCSALDANNDGKIGSADVARLAKRPEAVAANQQKAKSYADNYIPSDDQSGATTGRPITQQDAVRELNNYSDYLPKDLSPDDLQKIVNGTSGMGKCPPQVQAAAQYFKDHPDDWKSLNNGKDSVSKSEFQTNSANKTQLTSDEQDAAQRVLDDPNGRFNGKITLDSLKKIAQDPNADPKDKAAAETLLGKDGTGSNMFHRADNFSGGNKDYTSHGMYSVDDAVFNKDNVRKMMGAESAGGVAAPAPAPATSAGAAAGMNAPETSSVDGASAARATADMLAGEDDMAGAKKEKQTGVKKFVNGLVDFAKGVLAVGAKMFGAIAKFLPIPGIEQMADGISTGLTAAKSGLNVMQTSLNGGDTKKAAADGAFDIAGAATAMVPGAGIVGGMLVDGAKGAYDSKAEGAGKSAAKGALDGASQGIL
jgi:type III secretion translocon protein HrpF